MVPSPAEPIFLEWFNIELASRCNLRCKWCSLDFDKPSVNMDEALLGQALDEVLSSGWTIGEIALHNGGEALMHPRLQGILDVIASKRAGRASFPVISLLTNGVLLNERKARQVLDSGAVDLVRFSVDGGSAAAFEEFRTPAKWITVRDNIHRFVKMNNAAARRVRTGVICMIAPGKPADLDWMEEEFREVLLAVDYYEIRYPHNWDGSKDLGLNPEIDTSLAVVPLNLLRKGRALLHEARVAVAPRLEFLEKPGDVGLDGIGRDVELRGDLLVGTAGGEFAQDRQLVLADPEAGQCLRIAIKGRGCRAGEDALADDHAQHEESDCDQEDVNVAGMYPRQALVVEPLQG